MVSAKRGSVIPWSYSSLQQYENCPRRTYLTRITKQVVEQRHAANNYGNDVHKVLEDACKGTRPLPTEYVKHHKIVEKVRAAPGTKLYEHSFGLSKDLTPVGFWHPNVWVRGKLDVAIVRDSSATILDWKTGKRKLDLDQLKLFALAAFSEWPHVETVNTGYVWLLGGTIDKQVFTREHKVEIHRDFAARVHRMESSEERDVWEPRPSGLCREYCPVGRSLCEFCGKP